MKPIEIPRRIHTSSCGHLGKDQDFISAFEKHVLIICLQYPTVKTFKKPWKWCCPQRAYFVSSSFRAIRDTHANITKPRGRATILTQPLAPKKKYVLIRMPKSFSPTLDKWNYHWEFVHLPIYPFKFYQLYWRPRFCLLRWTVLKVYVYVHIFLKRIFLLCSLLLCSQGVCNLRSTVCDQRRSTVLRLTVYVLLLF